MEPFRQLRTDYSNKSASLLNYCLWQLCAMIWLVEAFIVNGQPIIALISFESVRLDLWASSRNDERCRSEWNSRSNLKPSRRVCSTFNLPMINHRMNYKTLRAALVQNWNNKLLVIHIRIQWRSKKHFEWKEIFASHWIFKRREMKNEQVKWRRKETSNENYHKTGKHDAAWEVGEKHKKVNLCFVS